MIDVDKPALGGVVQDLIAIGMVRRKTNELRLARLANRVGSFFEFLAPRPLHFGFEVAVADDDE